MMPRPTQRRPSESSLAPAMKSQPLGGSPCSRPPSTGIQPCLPGMNHQELTPRGDWLLLAPND